MGMTETRSGLLCIPGIPPGGWAPHPETKLNQGRRLGDWKSHVELYLLRMESPHLHNCTTDNDLSKQQGAVNIKSVEVKL